MTSRRSFIRQSSILATGSILLPACDFSSKKEHNLGVQLYTFRDAMAEDAIGTLKRIAGLGIKQIETARSNKGHYYGLGPKEMKNICDDLGMTLRSGHVHLDDQWPQTMAEAVEAGQEYLICSTMPTEGQTVSNYKNVADVFNKAGEACQTVGIKFGYHNHGYEFESNQGAVLYDILMDNTEANLVYMELDLGWVIVGGKNPIDYFNKYPGRFPLWHLKDMDMAKKESTEFGKGGLDIPEMLAHKKESGLKYIFIEQEEYATAPFESIQYDLDYLEKLGDS